MKIWKKLLVAALSLMMVIAMSATAFAYTAVEDDGDRKYADDTSYNKVYGTTGMLRIVDEGTSIKVNDDDTVTVTAKTSSSKTWGKITKIALIEQTATAEEKDAAAKDVVFDDTEFHDAETSRSFTFTIPMSDVGKKIPVCRFDASENAWKDFSTQQYYIVEKSAVPTDLKIENNVSMFKPEALSVTGKEGAYVLHLTMGSKSYDAVYVGYAADADLEKAYTINIVDGKGYVDIPVESVSDPIVLAFHGSKFYNRTLTIDLEEKTAVFDPTAITLEQFDNMTLEEALARAADDTNAETVSALIEAIQVQTRDENTDKYCELAKAYYDALKEKDKAAFDEKEDYFGRDTGDASKDDPRNQDNIGEKELLVVSFGTSFNDSRVADIKSVEDALQAAYPDWQVRRAFTAQIIINHIQARDGEKIDNMTQALDRAVANGVKTLIVQPTHLMHGAEYDELTEELKKYEDKMTIVVAEPLLGEVGASDTVVNADKEAVAKAAVAEAVKVSKYDTLEAAEADGAAIVFMGHGTSHAANITYAQMQAQMTALGYKNVFVGTVEGKPESTALPEVKKAVEAAGYKKIILRPLMVVAGDHANNDMAADEEGTWFYGFANGGEFEVEGAEQPVDIGAGFGAENVTCQIEGLGRIADIQAKYVAHTKDAIDKYENPVVELKDNTMTVKAKKITVKAKKKTVVKASKAFTVKKNQGKVTYKKAKGDKKITISKAGKITVKKGLKKGKTYKVTVKVTAAGNAEYKALTKTVTLKIKVK